jgi:orotate phosphoribosyltransferase
MTLNKEKLSLLETKYIQFSDPKTIDIASTKLIQLLPNEESYQLLVGVELGSIALASLVSLKSKKPSILLRKASKKYGTLKLIEGSFSKDENVVIIEDVLHTTKQLDDTFEKLETAGLKIHSIVTYANFLDLSTYKNIPISAVITDNNEL